MINNKNNPIFLYCLAAIVGLGGILFGYNTGVMSGAIIFIRKTFSLTTFQTELTIGSILFGAFIGALVNGKISDCYGRKTSLFIASICFIIGSLSSAYTPYYTVLLINLFVIGFAIGIASFVVPLYISEIAPTQIRGGLIILNTIAVTGGIVIAYLVDLGFAKTENWHLMLGSGIIPASLMGIGLLFSPESPRWLMKHGYKKKAKRVLMYIRHRHDINNELKEIEKLDNLSEDRWSDLLQPVYRPVIIIGIGLAIIQQVTGINVILYYSPVIFKMAGFKGTASQILATLGMGLTNFIMTIIALCIVDKAGRRKMLLISLTMMTIALMCVALSFNYAHQLATLKWICVISLAIFVASYALGIGCLFWLLISEIYPLKIRGKAMSLAAATNWCSNSLVATTILSLFELLGPSNTFWIYTVFGILSIIFCYLLVPETRLISLEEIEANLRNGKSSRELGQPIGNKAETGG